MPHLLVIGVASAYLLGLFGIAYWADQRARLGRSIAGSPWVYALSMGVYCSAWTYFGSIDRAANQGVLALPVYLGAMLAMVLGGVVLRKMVRIAKTHHITSIADFIASRYGKSITLAGLVTVITVIAIVPYIALQLKAVSVAYNLITTPAGELVVQADKWWQESAFYIALVLAVFSIVFGVRHIDSAERHEGMVVAIAFESIVKLLAFVAIGLFVTYGLNNGLGDIFERVAADEELSRLLVLERDEGFPYVEWFSMVLLAMFSLLLLPRQFQVMVVENVDEKHIKRAAWVFPLYLLLINLFVLPIALGGLLVDATDLPDAETFMISLPWMHGHNFLALLAFVGGVSAATGMVIVESVAVATMVSNDLVVPLLLRYSGWGARIGSNLPRVLLNIRRGVIFFILMSGFFYFHLAGSDYELASIVLISFAAVAQFAPALFGGMYWKGGTRSGAQIGLLLGFSLWAYTLMLPSLADAGWLDDAFVRYGPWEIELLRPERLLGLTGLDALTHGLFWSLLFNMSAYVLVSIGYRQTARETSQALLFVDVFERTTQEHPVLWRGTAAVDKLLRLVARFLGQQQAEQEFADYGHRLGLERVEQLNADAQLVHFVETRLAGLVGSATARIMVAAVVDEEPLDPEDVMRIVDEASQWRAYSREMEEKSRILEQTTVELRSAYEQLQSLDRLKDDFMSSVSHELRTPLTSVRALSELIRDDASMPLVQREQFLGIIVAETERLTRLVNQVLDMAKIESGSAEWHSTDIDLVALLRQSVHSTSELFRENGVSVELSLPDHAVLVKGDGDRLMQVVLNLLSNAAKFAPRNEGIVHVALGEVEQGVKVEVRDNGPGIPSHEQALVFEKFRQGGTFASRPPGTGLGLYISRQIIEHMGGRIWLEPQKEAGACFAFFLPVGQVTQQTEGDGA